MKRVMMTSLVAGLAGTLGLASVASAESTLYGSVRSGLYMKEMDGDTTWDIGSVDAGDLGSSDRLWSRIGVRASTELDNGLTAGLHIEKRLDDFRTRHQNVWLEGAFGRVTLGQQGSPYYSATSWDGSNFFGGSFDVGSRKSGLRYSSNLGGPFSFSFMVVDDNSKVNEKTVFSVELLESQTVEGIPDIGINEGTETSPTGYGSGLDGWEATGSFAAGPVNINAGYMDEPSGTQRMGVTAGGSAGGAGWEVGFESRKPDGGDRTERYGFFADYSLGDGAAYLLYEHQEGDDALVVGYGHNLGPGVAVIAEHRSMNGDSDVGALVLRVDF